MSNSYSTKDQKFEGIVINNRWKIHKLVQPGIFGNLYSGNDAINGNRVSVKIKSNVKATNFIREVHILQQMQFSRHICRYIFSGKVNNAPFIVLTTLGPTIHNLRLQQKHKTFPLSSIIKMSLQMLKAIQDLHSMNYVHCDISPMNFAIGGTQALENHVFMIDFSFTQKIFVMNSDGDANPIKITGFGESVQYISSCCHLNQQVGRVDDLWSLLYILLEMRFGRLPWSNSELPETVSKMKKDYDLSKLLSYMPREFTDIYVYLQEMPINKKPNYQQIFDLITNASTRYRVSKHSHLHLSNKNESNKSITKVAEEQKKQFHKSQLQKIWVNKKEIDNNKNDVLFDKLKRANTVIGSVFGNNKYQFKPRTKSRLNSNSTISSAMSHRMISACNTVSDKSNIFNNFRRGYILNSASPSIVKRRTCQSQLDLSNYRRTSYNSKLPTISNQYRSNSSIVTNSNQNVNVVAGKRSVSNISRISNKSLSYMQNHFKEKKPCVVFSSPKTKHFVTSNKYMKWPDDYLVKKSIVPKQKSNTKNSDIIDNQWMTKLKELDLSSLQLSDKLPLNENPNLENDKLIACPDGDHNVETNVNSKNNQETVSSNKLMRLFRDPTNKIRNLHRSTSAISQKNKPSFNSIKSLTDLITNEISNNIDEKQHLNYAISSTGQLGLLQKYAKNINSSLCNDKFKPCSNLSKKSNNTTKKVVSLKWKQKIGNKVENCRNNIINRLNKQ